MKIIKIEKEADLSKYGGFGNPTEIQYAIADDNGKILDDAHGTGTKQ